ncbi:P-loop containing nucleoside triphosphate hydrolase protein [Pavlovales sp. CCMP2436]|nr:P-loop containing nucleoside triphosphate hydrolase protein [Pavlovales sp. CCMP2436]
MAILLLGAWTAALGAAAPNAWTAAGLAPHLARVPATLGWAEPTEIQRRCIAPILAGQDVIGQAATGSGKTGAYALPLIQRLAEECAAWPSGGVRCLVLVPTRELCVQVAALANPPDVLVATPGRLLDHIDSAGLSLPACGVTSLVLDEADRLLELGFFEAHTSPSSLNPQQLIVFSATMPQPVIELVNAEMREPHRALLADEGAEQGLPAALQLVGLARLHALRALLREQCAAQPRSSALVFCNTRVAAMRAWKFLNDGGEGLVAALLSGEMEQPDREQSLFLLRQQAVHALVATDLGARGLDVDGLELVVNFELPPEWDRYAHTHTHTHTAGRFWLAVCQLQVKLILALRRRLLRATLL